MPESSVRSYFKELSSSKWELQLPEDPTSRQSMRWPIGFVTTGFVRGRLVCITVPILKTCAFFQSYSVFSLPITSSNKHLIYMQQEASGYSFL